MVFLRGDFEKQLLYFHSINDLCNYLSNISDYYLHDGQRIIGDLSSLVNDQEIRLCLRLPGGKGGFGSNLRAQGNRLSSRKRSGNYESCRDLATGLRLRDLDRAKVIKTYEETGGDQSRLQEKHRQYRERLEKKAAEFERKDKAFEKRDALAIERAHLEASKIEDLTLTSLKQDPKGERKRSGRATIVCGWEDDAD